VKEVDARHDLVGSTLATLVLSCHQNGGVLSRHRRKQFDLAVPAAAFDLIEAAVRKHLGQRGSLAPSPASAGEGGG
jgi:hypothetical protein